MEGGCGKQTAELAVHFQCGCDVEPAETMLSTFTTEVLLHPSALHHYIIWHMVMSFCCLVGSGRGLRQLGYSHDYVCLTVAHH